MKLSVWISRAVFTTFFAILIAAVLVVSSGCGGNKDSGKGKQAKNDAPDLTVKKNDPNPSKSKADKRPPKLVKKSTPKGASQKSVGSKKQSGVGSDKARLKSVENDAPWIKGFDDAINVLKVDAQPTRIKLGLRWLTYSQLTKNQDASAAKKAAQLMVKGRSLPFREMSEIVQLSLDLIEKKGGKEQVPDVIKCIDERIISSRQRLNAIKWYGQFDTPEAVDELLKLLEKNNAEAEAATEALKKVGPETAKKLMAFFNTRLNTKRKRCREILKAHGVTDTEITKQCVLDCAEKQYAERENALNWLTEAKVDPALQPKVQEALLKVMQKEPDRLARKVIHPLIVWGDEKCCKVINQLLVKIPSAETIVVDFLSRYKNVDSTEALVKLMTKLGSTDRKIVKIVTARKEMAAPFVVARINSANQTARYLCRKMAKEFEIPDHVLTAQTLKDLESKERYVAEAALEYLKTVEPDDKNRAQVIAKTTPLIQKYVGKQTHSGTLTVASMVFCRWASESDTEMVQILVDHPNSGVYLSALECQVRIDPKAAGRSLKKLLAERQKNGSIRQLMKKLPADAEPVLIPLLSSKNDGTIITTLEFLQAKGSRKALSHISRVIRKFKKMENKSFVVSRAEAAAQAIRARGASKK